MLAFGLTLGACQCNVTTLKGAPPSISATPNPVVIPQVLLGGIGEVLAQVTNHSAFSMLKLSADPELLPGDGTDAGVFTLDNVLTADCTGRYRSGELKEIPIAGCATINIRYTPVRVGTDSATLRFRSNDPAHPIYDVPIQASAASIHVQVCVDEDSVERCNEPGQPLTLSWAEPNDIGTPRPRSLKLQSTGSIDVQVDSLIQAGDPAFTMTPAPTSFAPFAITPSNSWPFTLSLTRPDGKPRQGAITFTTNDPDNIIVTVDLAATGGPALCWCIGSDTEPCEEVSVANFGDVDLTATAEKYLELTSCGSEPLTFVKQSAPTDPPVGVTGDPAFTGDVTRLPTAGWQVEPDHTPIRAPLRFQPTQERPYTGQLEINTNIGTVTVPLAGNGRLGCSLSLPTLMDFGSLTANHETHQDLTLTNVGNSTCTFPMPPAVTLGGGVVYRLEGTPPTRLEPGGSVSIVVHYQPEDATGPDIGEVSVYVQDVDPTAVLETFTVSLTGVPLEELICKLQAVPALSPIRNTLNFGTVEIGHSVSKTIRISNTGNGPCSLSNLHLVRGNGASAFTLNTASAPATLAAFTSFNIDLSFLPTALTLYGPTQPDGSDATRLQLDTSDTATFDGSNCARVNSQPAPQGCAGWELAGTGVASTSISVQPGRLEFGTIRLGCHSLSQTLTIYNTGTTTFRITDYHLDPATSNGAFTVSGPTPPIAVPAGGHADLVIGYMPMTAASETTSLLIKTDLRPGTTDPDAIIPIVGNGVTSTLHTDSFIVGPLQKADVLFVVDDSASMAQEQQHFTPNLTKFMSIATSLQADYHLAVITTDAFNPSQAGRFQGSPTVISTSSQATSLLVGNILGIGVMGSGEERGMQAVNLALTSPLVTDPRANAGFLRSDAYLDVLVIADEDDQSEKTVDFYQTFLQNLKGPNTAQLVSFSAVVGPGMTGCTSNVGTAVYGSRYIDLQARTRGQFQSICDPEWSRIAYEMLGIGIDTPRLRFQLRSACDPATLQVNINNVPISSNLFTYDAATNAVLLDPSARPGPGTIILVSYSEPCL